MAQPDNQAVVFRRTADWNFEETTFTARNLQVLACIDGSTPLTDICDVLKLTASEIESELAMLQRLDLIVAESHSYKVKLDRYHLKSSELSNTV